MYVYANEQIGKTAPWCQPSREYRCHACNTQDSPRTYPSYLPYLICSSILGLKGEEIASNLRHRSRYTDLWLVNACVRRFPALEKEVPRPILQVRHCETIFPGSGYEDLSSYHFLTVQSGDYCVLFRWFPMFLMLCSLEVLSSLGCFMKEVGMLLRVNFRVACYIALSSLLFFVRWLMLCTVFYLKNSVRYRVDVWG